MPLVLTFTGQPPDGLPPRFVVPPAGASLGRGQANDFVLPDPQQKLSRRHCEIRPDRGGWLLFDLSTNGTFLNDHPERLDPRVPVLLQNGDSILLGDYLLVAVIEADAPALPDFDYEPIPTPPPSDIGDGRFNDFNRERYESGLGRAPDDPFGQLPGGQLPGGQPPGGAGAKPFGGSAALPDDWDAPPPGSQGSIHRDALYQVGRVEPAPDFSAGADHDDPFAAFDLDLPPPGAGSQHDHAAHGDIAFEPPTPQRNILPDNWMDEEPLLPPPPPQAIVPPPPPQAGITPVSVPGTGDDRGFDTTEPPPVHRAPPPTPPAFTPPEFAPSASGAGGGDALAAFLAGAGISAGPGGDPAEALYMAGRIFRVMVEGTRSLVQARARLKNEFRIEQTMIGSANNNPLKFAVTGDEAVAALLQPARQGYLAPQDAAREVFSDLEAHELAVMVAVQAAMKSVLKRIDPATIRAKVDAEGGSSFSLAGKKPRYWELYEVIFGETLGGLDEDFDKIFGRVFASAYEDQLRRF